MKKPVWNLIIDVLSLIVFTTMISIGLLLKYVLPPGSGRVEMVLSSKGRGHQTIDLFMGLARHDWGEIHFYLSLGFLVFLIIHLVLHWNWIVCMLWGTKEKPLPKKRRIIAVGVIIFVLTGLLFPWVGQMLGLKKTLTRAELQDRVY